jgi:hypothetical protein
MGRGGGVNHLPHLVPRLKKECISTCTSPLRLHGLFQGQLYKKNEILNISMVDKSKIYEIYENVIYFERISLVFQSCKFMPEDRIMFRVSRRIFGPKRNEVTGEGRKLHNKELNNLYS